jgi:perosamine synthetase
MMANNSKWVISLAEPELGQEEINSVCSQISSGWLSMGEKTREFEKKIMEITGAKYCLAVTNCTAALHIACLTAKFKEGDEVLVPSLSFIATANAVKYTGATPIFCDIDSFENPVVTLQEIKKKMTDKTKGIIVMHYGGYQSDIIDIKQFAKEKNLILIEDAAHAIGSKVNGHFLGTIGNMGCYSFFSNKNITTGEGGAIVTSDPEIFNYMKKIRSHGMEDLSWDKYNGRIQKYDVKELGYNYRIDDIRSSIGTAQLEKLSLINFRRKKIVDMYKELINDNQYIVIPFKDYQFEGAYHIFPLCIINQELKEKIEKALHEKGVQTSNHYPPIHKFSLYRNSNVFLPKTEEFSKLEITLPLYASLKVEDVKYITSIINKVIQIFTKK